jgi:hypothetical protein
MKNTMAEAFALDFNKTGETTASLHRRKAIIARRARISIYEYGFDFDKHCAICHFEDPQILQLGIETTEGKIDGLICEKCAMKIIEGLEKCIDKRRERIHGAKQKGRKADHRKTGERSEVREGAGASDPRLRSEV